MKVLAAIIMMLGTVLSAQAQARDLVCLYQEANYKGAHFCFSPGQRPPNLDAFPLSDGTYTNGRFGSIFVSGAAVVTVYEYTNYQTIRTQPMYVDASIPDLSAFWNSTIYSIDVEYAQAQ